MLTMAPERLTWCSAGTVHAAALSLLPAACHADAGAVGQLLNEALASLTRVFPFHHLF